MPFGPDGSFSGKISELEGIEHQDERTLLSFTLPADLGCAVVGEANTQGIPLRELVRAAGIYACLANQIDGYRLTDSAAKVVDIFMPHDVHTYPEFMIGGQFSYVKKSPVPVPMGRALEELKGFYSTSLSELMAAGFEDRFAVRKHYRSGLKVYAINDGVPTLIVPIT